MTEITLYSLYSALYLTSAILFECPKSASKCIHYKVPPQFSQWNKKTPVHNPMLKLSLCDSTTVNDDTK